MELFWLHDIKPRDVMQVISLISRLTWLISIVVQPGLQILFWLGAFDHSGMVETYYKTNMVAKVTTCRCW